MEEVTDADLGVLEGNGYPSVAARQAFASKLILLAETTTALSDRLSMRHFSHTERALQVMTA
jgi:hypothetical protein